MTSWLPTVIAASLYSLAFALRLSAFLQVRALPQWPQLLIAGGAVAAHGIATVHQVIEPDGIDLSLLPLSSTIFFVINAIVVLSALRNPLENLFLMLFPATVAMLTLAVLTQQHTRELATVSAGVGAHILLSLLSYSLMTIAALQALLLAWQNRRLHDHQPGGRLRALPPLLTMELLLFRFLLAGFVLLTAGLLSGFVYVEDFFAQHLAHKTVFSLVAWALYAVLLWGHYRRGWRGRMASYWALGGFCALMLAFWGTKFVLEVLIA
ncbi:MAG TPA: cytochrome c biogenesis protein CcsA [Porticoccaceae bacterium]|nr:cytochrome c biogenesis protein CcsA [Porticoccaceae bacterium]